MNNALSAVRGALADLLNAIDDAKGSSEVTEAGVEALNVMEKQVEALTHQFDAGFEQS